LDRDEKGLLIEDLRKRFEGVKAAFVAEYCGINVEELTKLRRLLKATSADFRVTKNTLARLALKGTDKEPLIEFFDGPTAIALSYEDPVVTAGVLTRFAKDQPYLRLKAGVLGGKVINLEEIKALSEIPPREVLLGRLVGLLKATSGNLVYVLGGIQRKFVGTLEAIKAKKQVASNQ